MLGLFGISTKNHLESIHCIDLFTLGQYCNRN